MSAVDSARRPPILGIDLGTTHSLVAVVKNGVPRILMTREGNRLLPSVISFSDASLLSGDQWVVGYKAKEERYKNPLCTVSSVKRLLGKSFSDVDTNANELQLSFADGIKNDGSQALRIKIGGNFFSPIELSAAILKELKLSAEKELGEPVSSAVITVPAYFDDAQRQATRLAGQIAGLDVLRILNEPTAAALAYGMLPGLRTQQEINQKKIVAVYDFGGGTFDISILKLYQGAFEVLATRGNTALGGDDIDSLLFKVFADEIKTCCGIDPREDKPFQVLLLDACEKAKMELSAHPKAEVSLHFGDHLKFERVLNIEEFETLAKGIIDQTIPLCLAALEDSGVTLEDIDEVLMVGGTTRMPLARRTATQIFKKEVNISLNPEEAVALGAALQADILSGGNSTCILLDVVPLTLGIETYGGIFSPLIKRNTKIPAVVREVFTTFVDNQTAVDIHVLQGERERVEDNRSLARFKLQNVEPKPATIPRIEVKFLIDADGILAVSAKDLHTGNFQSIDVRPTYGLTEEQIRATIEKSVQTKDLDESYRKLVESRNYAEPIIRATEKGLSKVGDSLTQLELVLIEEKLRELKSAFQGDDPDQINKASETLAQSTQHLADVLFKDAIAPSSNPS